MPEKIVRTFGQAGALAFVLLLLSDGDKANAADIFSTIEPLINEQNPSPDVQAAISATEAAINGASSIEDAFEVISEASSNVAL